MKGLFSLENPLMQFLTRACDLMIVNLLFLVSCVPVVTIGAALCGLNKVCQAIVMGDEQGIWKLYVSGFRDNFKQATVVWLSTLLVAASLVCYWLIVVNFCRGTLATILLILMAVLAVVALSHVVYLFPLIARYENTLREHVKNAGILAITRLFLTPLLIVFTVVFFLLPYISLEAYLQTLIFWVIIGFAFLCYMSNILLKPIYQLLESPSMQKNYKEPEEEE
jgi:uncharacterized membrane protein YesL